jgi:hypothetical protein
VRLVKIEASMSQNVYWTRDYANCDVLLGIFATGMACLLLLDYLLVVMYDKNVHFHQ